jgi:TPR repeat protein
MAWYRKAAELGCEKAQFNLSMVYGAFGQDMAIDLAAKQGQAGGQFKPGAKYAKGESVAKNTVMGVT